MKPKVFALHEELRRKRQSMSLSQRSLAVRAGIAQSYICRMESMRRPRVLLIDTYAKWAAALEVEFGIYYVVDGQFTTINLTEDEKAPPPSA